MRVTLTLVGITERIDCRVLELQALIAFVCKLMCACIREAHVRECVC